MMSDDFLLSREDVLGGMPARRASTLLFAIESRTAYLVGQSRLAAARVVTQATAEEQEQSFLSALARGRDLPFQPAIQDLERYAPRWADLVPDNPGIRAAVIHLLGEKYAFTPKFVPRIRAALGLDQETVQDAYQRTYHEHLDHIYAPSIAFSERLRWRWAGLARRLEELPPFWSAYALTVTETVGASILALPIALAGVGPLAGLILLVVLGLVNILTLTSIVEAITRTGTMRYGSSYFGALVTENLGKAGSLIFTVVLVVLSILTLIAYYTGVATTLAEATGLPNVVWAAALFLVAIYFLRRESLDATIAFALLVGFINISLILVLSLIALPFARLENLSYVNVPFVNGRPFDPGILALVFGVVLSAYFGHTSAGNAAKLVLHRDPGGRSLLWGNVAALATAIVLYSVWVVAVNGAIAPDILAQTTGTALIPLAAEVGPIIYLFGSIYVVLGMGMASIHYSLGLFNQMREWLPLTLSSRSRSLFGISPVAFVFLLATWLLWTGQESYAGIISFYGVITVPLVAGVFPVLMLVASRRKGDSLPGTVWEFLGHPLVVGLLYLIFLASVFLHGAVIWQNPFQRAAALFVSAAILIVTIVFAWRKTFSPRQVLEIRVSEGIDSWAEFAVVSVGKPALADVTLSYGEEDHKQQAASGQVPRFSSLRSATFQLPVLQARELKVWVHKVSPEGVSEPLPARLTVQNDGHTLQFDLGSSGGQVISPLTGESCQVEIRFASAGIN